MARYSQDSYNPEGVRLLEDQIRDSFGRVTYSYKTHEKCADGLLAALSWIKRGQILLAAISTAGFISMISGTGAVGSFVGAGFSAALLALNLYTKEIDLSDAAQKHRQTGSNLWLIRERYLSLITDLVVEDITIAAIRAKRDALTDELHEIYKDAPSTTSWAYKRAQKALKWNEEMSFSAGEIDAFLPENLRYGKRMPI